jgi:hypothetical protein
MTARSASNVLGRAAGLAEALSEGLGDAARVARFLRGYLEFAPRPDDIHVVAYPRSGTTWMQLIVHLLTADGDLDFDHISQVAPWFERSLAVGALSAADLEAMDSPRIFKSHLPAGWVPAVGRRIYLQRQGRDVALSYFHFYCSHLRFDGSLEEFIGRFLRGRVQYGSWSRHVAGWQARRGQPGVLLLQYEELQADLAGCLRRLASFLRLDPGQRRLERIRELASFETMKRHEDKFDFITEYVLQRGYRRGVFLRQGRVGEGAAGFPPALEAAFLRHAGRRYWLPGLEWRLPAFLR